MATTKNFAATITIGGTLTSGLKGALGSAKTALRDIGSEITKLQRANKGIGSDIRVFDKLGRNVEGLRAKYAATVKTVEQLRTAQSRLVDAQATRERLGARAGKMAVAGAGAAAAGGAIIGSMVPGVNEAKHYQNEMARITALGLGEEENKKAIKYAQEMKAFGVSQVGKLELMRDAMSIFGDEHHAEMVLPTLAKMKFGNAAVFGGEKGTENSAAFMDMLKVIETRGGLKSEAEFNKQANIIQRVISATGGRVGGTEWRHFLQQAGLIGKSMDSEALFYTMEHLVQEMGGDKAGTGMGSLYTSLYQGTNKTRNVRNMEKLGLIGDKSKVIHDKQGQTSKLDPGALLGADLFRSDIFAWMQTVLIPQLKKKGITSEQQIMDTFGMIASNTVGTRFLAEMYRQRDIIERKRNNIKNAQDVDQLAEGGQKSAAGKELDAHAKFADAQKNLGENILPLYTKALVAASDALVSFNKFTEANPALSNAIVVGVTAIGVGLVALGPLLVAAGGFLNLYAAAQLRVAAAATAAATATSAETAAIVTQNAAAGGGALGKFGKFAGKALGAVAAVGVGLEVAKMAGLPDVNDDTQKKGEQELREGKWFKASAHMSAGSWIKGIVTGAPAQTPAAAPAQAPAPASVAVTIGAPTVAPITPIPQIASVPANAYNAPMMPVIGSAYKATEPAPIKPADAGTYKAPEIPPMRSPVVTKETTIKQEFNYNITQLPGESAEELAKRITAIQERQAGVKRRGALTDGASTQ